MTNTELFQRYIDFYIDFQKNAPGGSITPHWMPDGSSFWFEDTATDGTVALVNPEAATIERVARAVVDPPISVPVEPTAEPRVIRKGFMEGLPEAMELPSPDGRWLLTLRDHNLWLRSATGAEDRQLTSDGTEDYFWDVLGATWAPDGSRLLAYKVDVSGVTRMPIIHWLEQVEEVEWIPYPRTGGRLPQRAPHLIEVDPVRVVPIEGRESPDQDLRVVGLVPDGSELILTRGNLLDNRVSILAADTSSGRSREILTETSETFISWGSLWGCPPVLLDSGRGVVVRSERDGWAHLYLYGIDGQFEARLTQGEFPVVGIVAVDEEMGWVYFTAHAEARLYDTHLYRVDLEGKNCMRLTEAEAHHDITMSPSRRYFIDTYSRVDQPSIVELRRTDGTLVSTLSRVDASGLAALDWNPPEEFMVLAADGVTELRGVLYKPHDFDPQERYPVIDSIYGGPQMTWVPRRFTQDSGIFSQALAQLGFIVIHVDGRGTPERSKAFQDVVYRNFGRNEIPDHVAALHQLAGERPYIDLDRVGIYGGSWGGYMAIRGMVLAPDVYKVAVALYPNVDLDDHDAGIEAYMGMPEDNPEGYEYASSLKMVDRIKGRILLMHGTSDTNVTFSCTMKMVNALMHAMKPYDLVVLPEQTHVFRDAGRRYAPMAISQFLLERLA